MQLINTDMSDDKAGTSTDSAGSAADQFGPDSKMDTVTDQERQISQHAKAEFDKGNYDACISSLGKVG